MLYLASGSPRRKELLENRGYKFIIEKADIDETMDPNLDAIQNVKNVSLKKALKVFNNHPSDVVLACDTIVVLHDKIYGKPHDKEDAKRILKELSGLTHEVISGVAILSGENRYVFCETSYVTFKELTDKEIDEYISTGEPMDKAGAYAIQGIGRKLIERFSGNLENIIGLPIDRVDEILGKLLWCGKLVM